MKELSLLLGKLIGPTTLVFLFFKLVHRRVVVLRHPARKTGSLVLIGVAVVEEQLLSRRGLERWYSVSGRAHTVDEKGLRPSVHSLTSPSSMSLMLSK